MLPPEDEADPAAGPARDDGLTPPLELFQDGSSTYNVANITGYAQRIKVNQAIVANPWRLRDGTATSRPASATRRRVHLHSGVAGMAGVCAAAPVPTLPEAPNEVRGLYPRKPRGKDWAAIERVPWP